MFRDHRFNSWTNKILARSDLNGLIYNKSDIITWNKFPLLLTILESSDD